MYRCRCIYLVFLEKPHVSSENLKNPQESPRKPKNPEEIQETRRTLEKSQESQRKQRSSKSSGETNKMGRENASIMIVWNLIPKRLKSLESTKIPWNPLESTGVPWNWIQLNPQNLRILSESQRFLKESSRIPLGFLKSLEFCKIFELSSSLYLKIIQAPQVDLWMSRIPILKMVDRVGNTETVVKVGGRGELS